ncbi:MAG: LacI family DNA-binding transcriptional regulator, partial [Burkholderiales bacterium]|nr:LacI family DNA-binding transcriptional regulator [Burkholderiales bacterium]
MSRRLVTSNDVARLAGVSQSTVSRAFRPGAPLSPTLRAKVEQAAAALGYTPNAFARGMIRGHSGLVGVVVDDLQHPLQAALFDALSRAIE